MRRPSLQTTFVASTTTPADLGRLLLQLVEFVRKSLEPLLSSHDALRSVVTADLTAATPLVINHKLPVPTGKTPEGWRITDIDAAATVYRSAWDDKTITLTASATCSVVFEVF